MLLNQNEIKKLCHLAIEKDDVFKFFEDMGKSIINEFKDTTLIGEIERPEGRETYEELKLALKKILKTFQIDSWRELIKLSSYCGEKFRAVMSLYFVWTGIFHYGEDEGNEFWPHVVEGLGFDEDQNVVTPFGQLFQKCLSENNLELFPHTRGHVNITRILLHGFIPEIYIDKFVHLVLHELSQPKGIFKTSHTIINGWLSKYSDFHYVQKPIKRFIEHGEPVSLTLLDRFLEMAKHWQKDSLNNWWEWRLPRYMVNSFAKCSKNFTLLPKANRKYQICEKPYIFFDMQRNTPLIFVPLLNLKESNCKIHNSPLQSVESNFNQEIQYENFFSPIQIEPKPAREWNINITNIDNDDDRYNIIYHFPSSSGKELPIFIFSSDNYKAISVKDNSDYPSNLIIVFPEEAHLSLSEGHIFTEPTSLSGSWNEWKFIYCELSRNDRLLYEGPNINFQNKISEEVFLCSSNYCPILIGSDLPNWIRCENDIPIITDTKKIQLKFSSQAYSLWRRSIGSVFRFATPSEKIKLIPFRLSFNQENNVVNIPLNNIQPGLYEIRLRGTIGIEDISYKFVYLPIEAYKKDNLLSSKIVDNFSIKFSQQVNFEATGNTLIKKEGSNSLNISVQDDYGDAFCAVRLFFEQKMSILLLFARSGIRWVRHNENSIIEWRFWRVTPEYIPIQRINEICDARVLIEIDSQTESEKLCLVNGKLKILLQYQHPNKNDINYIMSYEASKFKRNIHQIWVMDLKKFADQLKVLGNIPQADIAINNSNISLFSLLRHPEFKNLHVKTLKTEEAFEKIELSWNSHTNDPKTKRVLCASSQNNETSLQKSIPDNAEPPVTLELNSPTKPEVWKCHVEILNKRFRSKHQKVSIERTQTYWLRVPHNYNDWIATPQIPYCNIIRNSQSIVSGSNFLFSYFLELFHCKKDSISHQTLLNSIGVNTIKIALPFSKGKTWLAKSNPGLLPLEVIEGPSSDDIVKIFGNISPSQWYKILEHSKDGLNLKLVLKKNHQYLGPKNTVWLLSQVKEEDKPLMKADRHGFLDLTFWLQDAFAGNDKNLIEVEPPLLELWIKPPPLPILDQVVLKNQIFAPIKPKNLDNVFIEFLSRQENLGLKSKAIELIDKWKLLLDNQKIFNPLFMKMLVGRLDKNAIQLLPGVSAFICRLGAYARSHEVFRHKQNTPSNIKTLKSLNRDTLNFVKENLPKSLLQDLILSEIIISWYWKKNIYSK